MSKKPRKGYSRQFKMEAVGLISEKGYSIAEASRNLGIDYSVLRRWKNQLANDPQNAFPGKGRLSILTPVLQKSEGFRAKAPRVPP